MNKVWQWMYSSIEKNMRSTENNSRDMKHALQGFLAKQRKKNEFTSDAISWLVSDFPDLNHLPSHPLLVVWLDQTKETDDDILCNDNAAENISRQMRNLQMYRYKDRCVCHGKNTEYLSDSSTAHWMASIGCMLCAEGMYILFLNSLKHSFTVFFLIVFYSAISSS